MLFPSTRHSFLILNILANSRCLCGLLNGNIGDILLFNSISCGSLTEFVVVGVMKSTMGELTDNTNRADAFALMPALWAFGATMG